MDTTTPTTIRYLTGDATAPQTAGPAIIAHVCNDIGAWGAGFVLAVSRRWPEPAAAYRAWHHEGGNGFALGAVQVVPVAPILWVANMIAQHGTRPDRTGRQPIRYAALSRCLGALAVHATARGASVHMPRIGAGLAGGDWNLIEQLITTQLCKAGIAVTVYDLPRR